MKFHPVCFFGFYTSNYRDMSAISERSNVDSSLCRDAEDGDRCVTWKPQAGKAFQTYRVKAQYFVDEVFDDVAVTHDDVELVFAAILRVDRWGIVKYIILNHFKWVIHYYILYSLWTELLNRSLLSW